MNDQTLIDITGTIFPKFADRQGHSERFWFIKDQFLKHSKSLLSEGSMFSSISARLVNERWICDCNSIVKADIASFVWELRLFYMNSEFMSIYSFSTYMEENINNDSVKKFFKNMRESWVEYLSRNVSLPNKYYSGPIKTNKHLIDTLLYSDSFHTQEKYKNRYDELLTYMDESLILKYTYNAMHAGFQMNQISRCISNLTENNMVVLLPNHLKRFWI